LLRVVIAILPGVILLNVVLPIVFKYVFSNVNHMNLILLNVILFLEWIIPLSVILSSVIAPNDTQPSVIRVTFAECHSEN
jgi:hypothetical protein